MGKWLPWALIAGAVLLGLYLLKGGNSTEEMPAAADAAMEQVEGAAAEGAAAVEGAADAAATGAGSASHTIGPVQTKPSPSMVALSVCPAPLRP